MDLFSRKKQNTAEEDVIKVDDANLSVSPKKERSPARIFSLVFVLLFFAAVIALLFSDRESAVEDTETPAEVAAPAETHMVTDTGVVIPDYNQQPKQAQIEYPKVEKNSVVYEIRNNAAYVVGSVGGAKNMKYITIEKSIRKQYPVVEICEGAFRDCAKLQKVHIPDSVIIIRDSAFENCERLEQVRMSEGLVTMGSRVFAGCSSLKSLKFPASVKELSADVFEGAESLTSLRIPANCVIPDGADPFGLGDRLLIETY